MIQQNRRSFLKSGLFTTLQVLLAGKFGFSATKPAQAAYPSWTDLVEEARWCPSVHNLQPHLLKIISRQEAHLYYDPKRLLPVGDPEGIFVTVALGIFIEHLSIAAKPQGFKIAIADVVAPVDLLATSEKLFAKLILLPADNTPMPDVALIRKRRTSRLHYDGRPVGKTAINTLSTTAKNFGHQFDFTSNKHDVDFIIDLNQETLFYDISSAADRKELDHLFRYTKYEAETKRDGLWAKCMGFSAGLMKSVFRHHKKWEHGLLRSLLKKHYIHLFNGTATVGWFTGRFSNTADWLQAGQMLAHAWLGATAHDVFLHPFGSLITNKNAYAKLLNKLPAPRDGEQIWMIFRAGYSAEPARSYRLSAQDIIKTS